MLAFHFHVEEVKKIDQVVLRARLTISLHFSDSVLRFLRRFQSYVNLIDLLCDAAYFYHPSYICESREIDEKTKAEIYRRATNPCSLKNIARKQIRNHLFNSAMKLRLDQSVKKLDLPDFLQSYLLFQNA